MTSAFRRVQKRDSIKQLKEIGNLFFYQSFHRFFFPKDDYEGIFFATICAQNIARFCYAAFSVIFLSRTHIVQQLDINNENWFWVILSFITFLLLSLILGDYLPRLLGTRFPEKSLHLGAPFSSLFMFIAFPLTYIFLKVSLSLSRTVYFDYSQEPTAQAKREIIEMIQESHVSPALDVHDKKLIESVLTFRDRIAREVMVPRVDVFSLSAETTIRDAAKLLQNEGYSRTPVYRNTVDNIVGVLMYKDIVAKYMEYEQKGNDPKILLEPIETIQKNILYTPETKKISSLLQEFRKKKVHLAIVVDEYGGTEGIVTIEDILEEIVGEIADEYDQEAALYKPLPDGSWVLDSRMSIFDIEEDLDIRIPQEGDYDTIGGYIFHCTGSIPSKGFIIHHNDFEIEILESSDRSLEKVRIKRIYSNL